jgi:hypothetical protein
LIEDWCGVRKDNNKEERIVERQKGGEIIL